MPFFKQNSEMTLVGSPLMAENTFTGAEPKIIELPTYEDVRDRLPAPVWDGHDDYIACYRRAWELAFGNLRNPIPGTGFVSPFIDTAFNGCIFMWDSSFILMFGKYAGRLFDFQGTLDNFYSHQHYDGFICREIQENTGEDHFTRFDVSATGPEVMPWSEWEYYKSTGDTERLARVYPPLLAYHRWMKKHHTWRDGTYFTSGWGCGMDNLPRLPEGAHPAFDHGHMVWLDACMQEMMSCDILSHMSEILGRSGETGELEAEREKLRRAVNDELWDEETGFYYDKWRDGRLNMVRHIGAYWALISGAADGERAARLAEKLCDESEFKSVHRVTSLTKGHPLYCPNGDYWCGAVWAPANYMVLRGLERCGFYGLAYEIAREHLDAVVSVFRESGTLYENYSPSAFEKSDHCMSDFVGWTGLVPISVMFESVFGIRADATKNKLVWRVNLCERHGIERYPFGRDGELTLMCEARADAREKPRVSVTSDVPVTVEVVWDGGEYTIEIGNEQ